MVQNKIGVFLWQLCHFKIVNFTFKYVSSQFNKSLVCTWACFLLLFDIKIIRFYNLCPEYKKNGMLNGFSNRLLARKEQNCTANAQRWTQISVKMNRHFSVCLAHSLQYLKVCLWYNCYITLNSVSATSKSDICTPSSIQTWLKLHALALTNGYLGVCLKAS